MKVSLITSTYNSADTLQDTFDSVRQQDFSNLEYIVVDGDSKDGTIDLINLNKDIISAFVSEPDQGIYDALNKGINLATGDIVGFIHSDDLLAHDKVISKIADAFNDSSIDAVYGDLDYVLRTDVMNVTRKWRSKIFDPKLFYQGWMPAHPTFYLKKVYYDQFGLHNLSFKQSADYELMLRMLLKHGLKAQYIPEVLVKMRVGGASNVSFKNRLQANKEDLQAWKINGLQPNPFTRFLKPLSKLGQFFK